MLAEYFFPEDIKNEVNKLHNNRDINYDALNYADKHVYVWATLAVLTIFFVGNSAELNYKTLFFIFLYTLGPYFDIRLICQKYFTPYLFGEKRELVLTKIVTNIKYGDLLILTDEISNKEYKTHNMQSLNVYRGFLKPGDKIFCFLNPKSEGRCMPELKDVMQKTCLSKAIIKKHVK